MLPVRTVLHPTDFSEYSDYAFRLACALARNYGARLVIVHVAMPPTVYGDEVIPWEPVDCKDQAQEHLQRLAAPDPKIKVEHRLLEGEPAAEILRTAEETKADLIVMGTHGRTGVGRLLLGSVAELVVRNAPCPVVTVKMPQRQVAAEQPLLAGQGTGKS